MTKRRVHHVIFDIDGVMNTGRPRASEMAIEKYGLVASAIKKFFTTDSWNHCLEGRLCLKEVLKKELPKWGFSGSVDEYLHFWFETEKLIHPEMLTLIKSLRTKRIKCHIGSNQEKLRASYLWNDCALSEHFDSAFFSCHIGFKKPDSSFYNAICSSLHALPQEIALIDDLHENVAAAKSCGWQGFLWPEEKNITHTL